MLWGSTGTKNPSYSDIKYVTELIGKDTVSTMPQQTFQAFLDHGIVVQALPADIANTARVINTLRAAGIDIDMVCDKLQKDGIDIFKKSFDSLIKSIEQKSQLAAAAVQS